MAFVYGDRVKETSTSTGIGPITLGGATSGFQSFADGVGVGNETFYGIVNTIDNTWEMGRGTVGAGTITRDTVFSSSNAGALVNFGAGDKIVYSTVPADFFAGALDTDDHAGIDHTSAPLNLLDAATHANPGLIDHTAPPLSLLSQGNHEAISHTGSPWFLLNEAAHDAIDHTSAGSLSIPLLSEATHEAVDHLAAPFFLLDAATHQALDHSTANNVNPPNVTALEKTNGTETSLRSFSPLDIADMAGFHGGGGGGGGPRSFQLYDLTWSAETGSKSTPAIPFTPEYAIFISAFKHNTTDAGNQHTIGMGFATGVGTQKGVAQTDRYSASSDDSMGFYDEDAIALAAGQSDPWPPGGLQTNFSGFGGAWEISVTLFDATGITLQPSGGTGNITGKVFILVFGQ